MQGPMAGQAGSSRQAGPWVQDSWESKQEPHLSMPALVPAPDQAARPRLPQKRSALEAKNKKIRYSRPEFPRNIFLKRKESAIPL